jgi:hypothetical protein
MGSTANEQFRLNRGSIDHSRCHSTHWTSGQKSAIRLERVIVDWCDGRSIGSINGLLHKMNEDSQVSPFAFNENTTFRPDSAHDSRMGYLARQIPINDQIAIDRPLDLLIAIIDKNDLYRVPEQPAQAARKYPTVAVRLPTMRRRYESDARRVLILQQLLFAALVKLDIVDSLLQNGDNPSAITRCVQFLCGLEFSICICRNTGGMIALIFLLPYLVSCAKARNQKNAPARNWVQKIAQRTRKSVRSASRPRDQGKCHYTAQHSDGRSVH